MSPVAALKRLPRLFNMPPIPVPSCTVGHICGPPLSSFSLSVVSIITITVGLIVCEHKVHEFSQIS